MNGRGNARAWTCRTMLVMIAVAGCALAACRPPEEGRAPTLPQVPSFQASRVLGIGRIWEVALSPSGEYLAVAGSAGISVYCAGTFERVWNVPCTELGGGANSATFSPDGATLASGSAGGAVILWEGGR